MGLKWDQAEELAEVLAENHPGLNPLDARFTDLRQWVIETRRNWKRSRWRGTKFIRNKTRTIPNKRSE